MTHTFSKLIILFLIPLLLVACATEQPPTLGDTIKAQGAEYSKIGNNWSKGEKMIQEGRALQKAGEKNLKKAEQNAKKAENSIKDGKAMVKKGAALKQQAEDAYNKKKG